MTQLGIGLYAANHHENALSVQEAELSMKRRLGVPEDVILVIQGNLANSYRKLGRCDEALRVRQEVYSGRLEVSGEEHAETLIAANNYAVSLNGLQRFKEAKSLLRKTMPVARRSLGEDHITTLRMRLNYAHSLYEDDSATLDDLREAVTSLKELAPYARRTLGGMHPTTGLIEESLRDARAALTASETPPTSNNA